MVAWAVDGKWIFLTAYPEQNGKLLEMGLEGRNHVIVENLDRGAWIGVPVPSPDRKALPTRPSPENPT